MHSPPSLLGPQAGKPSKPRRQAGQRCHDCRQPAQALASRRGLDALDARVPLGDPVKLGNGAGAFTSPK